MTKLSVQIFSNILLCVLVMLTAVSARMQDGFAPSTVHKVQWSPDGSVIAAGRQDGLFLYDDEAVLVQSHDAGKPVFGVSWSPDGQYLASTLDSAVQIWRWDANLRSLSLERVLTGGGMQLAVYWSPDGTHIASYEDADTENIGGRGYIRIWGTATWVLEQTPDGSFWVTSEGSYTNILDWHPTGLPLLMFGGFHDTGSSPWQNGVLIINAQTGVIENVLPPYPDVIEISGVAWSPTGDLYVVSHPVVTFHRYPSGETVRPPHPIIWGPINVYDWSPEGEYLAIATDVIHVDDFQVIGSFESQSGYKSVDWHPAGNRVAAGEWYGLTRSNDPTTLPDFNAYPISVAGDDQSLVDTDDNGSESVALDGSVSYDMDGTITSYEWTLLGGGMLATTATVTVTLPTGTHIVRLTVTDNEGSRGTDELSVVVLPPPPPITDLTGHITLPSRTPGTSAYAVSLSVKLADSGGALVSEHSPTTDVNGTFTLQDLPQGTYGVWLKHAQSLAVMPSVTLDAPSVSLDFGTLAMGDADDSNQINMVDFSILGAAFGTSDGQPGYNADADFTGDSSVGISDFSLLAYSFGLVGAPPPAGGTGAPEMRVMETIPPELESARLRFLTSTNRSSVTTRVNNTFTILVRAGNSQAIQGISQIDGGEIHLTYDPTKLSIDALSDITAGASLGTVLQSQRNNTTGTLDYAAGTLTLPVQGEFTLVTIRFRALASTGSGVTLIQASSAPYRQNVLTLDGAAITPTPTPMSVKIR